MEDDHIGIRIEWIMKEYYNSNAASFARMVGISGSALIPIKKGEVSPRFKVIEQIMKTHRDINPDWLILGEGPRLRNDDPCWKVKQQNEELRQDLEFIFKKFRDRY